MSDIEPAIFCDFQQSKINPNLYICKHCNVVISSKNNIPINKVICSVLLDKAAADPRFDQIKLVKTTIEDQDGTTLKEYNHDTDKTKTAKIIGDWWYGNDHVSTHKPRPEEIFPTQQATNSANHCSQEQIDSRLAICKGCEFYKNDTCLKCGCALSRERNFMNKLYWKDKSCPIGKWGPVQ